MSEIKTNKISSLASNNDITIDPDGTGDTIIASGNVGIGNASPPEMLSVGDTSDTNVRLRITSSTSGSGTIQFGDGTGASGYRGYINYTHSDDALAFATSATERMRIKSDGSWAVSTTGYFDSLQNDNSSSERSMFYGGTYLAISSYNDTTMVLNRQGNDGTLISFRQAGSTEGTISVSGSTVSYNGGHLSRWSQLTDNTRDATIVKGTVMTNLDQMAEWTKDDVTEDNEQLNCMAVSSVEGDSDVAGVFVNWDDDDEDYTADMNVAMTGDMVIRIASGTTVARGDLLMSAGDGTAKPQDDDIVRSKTIAKVTSTNVSHTYDDGSYLIPCVLMAC